MGPASGRAFLFEHSACLRPLAAGSRHGWRTRGCRVSPGTLADSLKRFVPLFEPLAGAILAHQNRDGVAPCRRDRLAGAGVLSENGRSSRAWLWIFGQQADAVYFHIDPSRSAEVAKILFGSVTACIVFVVCDRYVAYKKLARELAGKVILCWCWVPPAARLHRLRRRPCAKLTRNGAREWIERIADRSTG